MHLAEREPQPPLDPVTAWRAGRLRHARFSAPLAERLARDREYDLHALLELTDGGCPPELAARILAPLPSPTEASP
jgi:hypothetical protein